MQKPPVVPLVSLPILHSTERFPVRRVYCVGRNYADHAKEMGDTGREPPFFFIKPPDTLFECPPNASADWPYPSLTDDLHHEVELVVALHAGGSKLSAQEARAAIWGYGLGLDMTRRDRQAEMKKQAKPWEIGKSFDHASPMGPLLPADAFGGLVTQGAISLSVNGETRQSGDLSQMIWNIEEMICRISEAWTLAPGDIIFTGTPAGVGPVVRGDEIRAKAVGLPDLVLRLV
ncbi:MhpD 2-keto-4-pentenoate hydratase/2-oxohepta-3-ene-1,7-dioic acid hydratase (catechol pathway) [Burkholderiales bacterium]